jgi:hypothetical protein
VCLEQANLVCRNCEISKYKTNDGQKETDRLDKQYGLREVTPMWIHNILYVYSLWQDLSIGTKIFDLLTLTLKFDLRFKNLNIGHIFLMVNNLILLVTQNLIGSFVFSEVFYILYCNLPWRHNAVEYFGVNNISSRHAKSAFSLKAFIK